VCDRRYVGQLHGFAHEARRQLARPPAESHAGIVDGHDGPPGRTKGLIPKDQARSDQALQVKMRAAPSEGLKAVYPPPGDIILGAALVGNTLGQCGSGHKAR